MFHSFSHSLIYVSCIQQHGSFLLYIWRWWWLYGGGAILMVAIMTFMIKTIGNDYDLSLYRYFKSLFLLYLWRWWWRYGGVVIMMVVMVKVGYVITDDAFLCSACFFLSTHGLDTFNYVFTKFPNHFISLSNSRIIL